MNRLPRSALVREGMEPDTEVPKHNGDPTTYSAATFSWAVSVFSAAAFASTSSTM